MSFEIETVSSVQRRLQFVVPGDEVAKKLDAAYKKLANRVRLPGFRPGKVPRKMLEQRYGAQLRSEVATDIINFEFQKAAPQVEFIGQPEVDSHDLPPNGDFRFAVTVQVKPAVEVKNYIGMKVNFPEVVVAESEIDEAVNRRLAGQARLAEVTDGSAIARGNLVLAEIKDGDTVVEAGTMVNTAGDKYYPGIEALLIGRAKGDTVVGAVTSAAGRSFEASITILGVQAQKVPDLTDEIATQLGFEGGVEAMKVALRMELETKATEAARNQARINLLRTLVDSNPVDVPAALTERNLKLLIEELNIQAQYRGRDPRSIRYSEAQLADLRTRAEFAAKAGVLLESIARNEGIRITDEDLDRKYQEIADMRGQRVEAIKGYIQKDGAVGELKRHLLEERTLDHVLERSELVTVPAEAPAAPVVDAAVPVVEPAAAEAAPAAVEAPVDEAPKAKKSTKKAKAEAAPVEEAAAAEPAAEEAKPKKAAKKKKDAAE